MKIPTLNSYSITKSKTVNQKDLGLRCVLLVWFVGCRDILKGILCLMSYQIILHIFCHFFCLSRVEDRNDSFVFMI